MNAKEWWLIVLGVLGAAFQGSIFPLFAVFFGEILAVFALPADQVLGEIHVWAGMFVALGVVSFLSVFAKVIHYVISLWLPLITRIHSIQIFLFNVIR